MVSTPDALLQLDYREEQAPLTGAAIANFAAAVGPVTGHMILSSPDAEAVAQLTRAEPSMRVGYDPCFGEPFERLAATRNVPAFVDASIAAAPAAEMIYLAYPAILEADKDGTDMIAAFHAHGRTVDAWTIPGANATTLPIIRRLLELRVDQITTDDPEGLLLAEG